MSCWFALLPLVLYASAGLAQFGDPAYAATSPSRAGQLSAETEAREAVARAQEMFAAGHYEGALSEFVRAYRMMENDARQAVVLNNIAVCYERMFRYELAIEFYQRYLREANPAAADRIEVRAAIRTLRGLLATVTIQTNVPSTVWVDNRRVGHAPGRLQIPSGHHVVELRARHHEALRLDLVVSARERKRITVELTRADVFEGVDPTVVYASGIVTTLVAASAVMLTLEALDAKSEVERLASASVGLRTEKTNTVERELGVLRTASYASYVALGVSGVTTLVLGLVANWNESFPVANSTPTAKLVVLPEGASLVVRGGFW